MDRKKVLFVLQQDPLSGSLARAGVDTALAYAAFDQPVTVLFTGAGVLQLAPEADAMRAGRRDLRRVIDSMPLYDIEAVLVDRDALQAYGLRDDLPAFAMQLDASQVPALYARHDHVMSF